jgi:serine/threonine-protein kinase
LRHAGGLDPLRQADALQYQLQNAIDQDYTLIRLLGRGGMGAVYLAREIALARLVAIKALPPAISVSGDRRAGFRREAQLAAKLSHPNIVPLHSFGEKDGVPYYVMDYVRGESLADRLRREGRIPHADARVMLAQLADALEFAHAKGVLHRASSRPTFSSTTTQDGR